MARLEKVFENPGCEYRGKPFWAWNGVLEEGELRRQIRVMKRMGLGGFFMHSRVGLGTPYLSDEWFSLVRACADEAKRQDMEAWLYDEDRWPSGAAGGLVTKDPQYRMRELKVTLAKPATAKVPAETLGLFAASLSDQLVLSGVRALKAKTWKRAIRPGETLLIFEEQVQGLSDWYNGYTYLDTLNPKAVRRYIEVTHKAYARETGKYFGRRIPGIFTDEPNYGHGLRKWQDAAAGTEGWLAPWTTRLPHVFEKRYGYSVLDYLPELFFEIAGQPVSRARYHYYDCLTHLFVDSFARQIGEWCESEKIQFTGHVLEEPTPRSQTRCVGSAMRFYEHMQAPGIDVLCEANREYDTAKQCASVADQFGRRWVLSEVYGCTGWQFPFEGHKAVGDWQAALGVNLRCQHLSWYTMAGQAKRDYPASIFFQSPWWELYPTVEDYFARVGTLISRGQAVRRLLVVHPLESTWARMTVNDRQSEELAALDARVQTLRDWLLEAHLDFDYGDEEMLSRLAGVKRGAAGPALRLGQCSYRAVLVPPTVTLRGTTLELLSEFARAGGRVVFCEPVAAHVDALPSRAAAEAAASAATVAFEREAVVGAVGPAARALSILSADGKEAGPVLYNLRAKGDERYLFICNTDRAAAAGPLQVVLHEPLEAEEWDAATGRRYRADFSIEQGRTVVRTSLEASGSACFVFRPKCEPGLLPRPVRREVGARTIEQAAWRIVRNDPNVLVLDRARYAIGVREAEGPTEILKVDQRVRAAIGLKARGGAMVQPWARKTPKDGPSTPLALEYRFKAEALPTGALFLALEQPQRFRLTLNGHVIDPDADAGWWTDPVLRLLPVDPNYVRTGENVLELKTTFTESSDLEAMFLLGEFGVRLDGVDATLVAAPAALKIGNWVGQGLPFYTGAVAYETEIVRSAGPGQRTIVRIPRFAGACVRVLVNGESAGVIGWRPYEVDITDLLREGANRLSLEVFSHRRNAFGPLHHRRTVTPWTGPGEFVTTGDDWREDYNLIECGLLESPVLSTRE